MLVSCSARGSTALNAIEIGYIYPGGVIGTIGSLGWWLPPNKCTLLTPCVADWQTGPIGARALACALHCMMERDLCNHTIGSVPLLLTIDRPQRRKDKAPGEKKSKRDKAGLPAGKDKPALPGPGAANSSQHGQHGALVPAERSRPGGRSSPAHGAAADGDTTAAKKSKKGA